jgi:hypothetical protein
MGKRKEVKRFNVHGSRLGITTADYGLRSFS